METLRGSHWTVPLWRPWWAGRCFREPRPEQPRYVAPPGAPEGDRPRRRPAVRGPARRRHRLVAPAPMPRYWGEDSPCAPPSPYATRSGRGFRRTRFPRLGTCRDFLASSASGSRLDVELPVGVAASSAALPDPESAQVVVAIWALQAEVGVPSYRLAVSQDAPEGGIDPPLPPVGRPAPPERESFRTPVFREPDVKLGARVDQHGRRVPRDAIGAPVDPAVRDQTPVLEGSSPLLQGRIGWMGR